MGYPPVFTGVWDVTFPPDTQLANQLGADLRSVRVDVMQRIALLSGTLANRPTPETVNATWGGAGFGLLYFSTDNGKIYQWNGGAWVDITANFINSGSGPVQTFLSAVGSNPLNIPANTLAVGSILDVTLQGNNNGGPGGSAQMSISVGGTKVTSTTVNGANFGNPTNLNMKLICTAIGAGGSLFFASPYGSLGQSIVVDTTSAIAVVGVSTITGTGTVLYGPLKAVLYP